MERLILRILRKNYLIKLKFRKYFPIKCAEILKPLICAIRSE